MATCTGLQNVCQKTTNIITEIEKNASVWADTHLTGLSILAFEDLYLSYVATEYERT